MQQQQTPSERGLMYPHRNVVALRDLLQNPDHAPLYNVILGLYLYLDLRQDENGYILTNYRQLSTSLRFGILKIKSAVETLRKYRLISLTNLGPGLGTKIRIL